MEKTVAAHHRCLKDPPSPTPLEQLPAPAVDVEQVAADAATTGAEHRALVVRTRQRYTAVRALVAQGKGIKPIVRELGLAKETVRRFVRAQSVEELLAKPLQGRPSILDQFKPYLHQRWNDGATSASQLFREIRQQGYAGSLGTVIAYLRPFRQAATSPPATPPSPKVRHITGWLLRHPDSLDADEQLRRKEVLARCPHLDTLARHVTAFAELLTQRSGDRLDPWIDQVERDELPQLRAFCQTFSVGAHRHDELVRVRLEGRVLHVLDAQGRLIRSVPRDPGKEGGQIPARAKRMTKANTGSVKHQPKSNRQTSTEA